MLCGIGCLCGFGIGLRLWFVGYGFGDFAVDSWVVCCLWCWFWFGLGFVLVFVIRGFGGFAVCEFWQIGCL